jgi:hypothetical protein
MSPAARSAPALFDIGQQQFAVDGAIEHAGRDEAVLA